MKPPQAPEKTNPIQTQSKPVLPVPCQIGSCRHLVWEAQPTLSVIEGNGSILERMNVNFCAAGYYRRVVLVPLNEHIDIIYKRFSFSNFVTILNL